MTVAGVASKVNKSLFDGVPGPSPWYLRIDAPMIPGFRWLATDQNDKSAGGKTALIGPNGPVAVLNYYNYVMTLDTSRLLIWYQDEKKLGISLTGPMRLFIVEPALLSPLEADLGPLFETMNAEKAHLTLGSGPIVEFSLATTDVDEELIVQFPDELEPIEELLILCRSSGIASPNLALLVARPKEGKYRIYPQDWFNLSDADFGYQWVTRVARNPLTGHVQGEGFRINPFILDDTLRSLRGTANSR